MRRVGAHLLRSCSCAPPLCSSHIFGGLPGGVIGEQKLAEPAGDLDIVRHADTLAFCLAAN